MNNVEYDIRHRGDHFFIEIRDEDRPNSEVLVVPVADPTQTKVPLLRGAAAQLLAEACTLATNLLHCVQSVTNLSLFGSVTRQILLPPPLLLLLQLLLTQEPANVLLGS